MWKGIIHISLCGPRIISLFYEHHGPLVSEFSIGFYLVSILSGDLNLALVCWTRFFPFLSPYCHLRSRNPSFMDWKSGKFYGVGVSQLPACSAW